MRPLPPFIKKIVEAGNHIDDSPEEKAIKSNLVVLAIPFALAGLIWGCLYYANDLILPGSIPFSYGILSFLSYLHFSIFKKYKIFRNSQLFLILILPFCLQISLGGFIQSSAVIMWAFIAPVGALVFFKAKQTIAWFVSYLILVIIAFFINDQIQDYFNWDLSEQFINVVFVLNLFAVSCLIYAVQYFYVNKQTELKESIEEKSKSLAEQAEKLKENDKLKSQFFANISHEFRTPLTLILGLLNKQISDPDKPPLVSDSETMKRNANRLLQLINQLLDLSKIEAGELKLMLVHDDIIPVIKNTALLYEPLGHKKSLEISFNGSPIQQPRSHRPIKAFYDKEKIQKLVSNLISNAIKFSSENGKINIEVHKKNKDLHISVSNKGAVIPAEKLPYIFNRFYQVDGESTRENEGTGIGLALVKELVELHHGSIEAKSNAKKTSFIIRMPLQASVYSESDFNHDIESPVIPEFSIAEDLVKTTEMEQTVTMGDREQIEILVVEDNPDIRGYIKGILIEDYKVLLAVDGEDGLSKAKEEIPDLIISDVMMPKMNGFELCKQLKTKEETDHIPIIMLTAKASHQNKLDGLETGADDYLTKPFDETELKVRIKNLINLREKLQKKYQQESYNPPKHTKTNSVQAKFLLKLRTIIEENIDNEEFTVEDLGNQLSMSRSQVHRKLKAMTNQSATQYIRNYRLHRAAELLKLNTGNITEIAYEVGFSSQTYFSKCFQELFDQTPSDFKSTYHK